MHAGLLCQSRSEKAWAGGRALVGCKAGKVSTPSPPKPPAYQHACSHAHTQYSFAIFLTLYLMTFCALFVVIALISEHFQTRGTDCPTSAHNP